ncbi:hypothetical protein SAMN05444161_8647 [Rhizobiales bacterium GAS191]|nr:hypothetical protein SAMN05444161_8647 [Rhizobiales bacterium GAS191]
MRTLATLAACAAIGLILPVCAQPQVAANSSIMMPSGGEPDRAFSTVVVAEFDSLPKLVREQVNAAASQRRNDELELLRRSIDTIPEASAALKAKGKSAAEVIAAAVDDDGALLLVTTTSV